MIIASVTFDGAKTNLATVRCLGASLNPTYLKPYFLHPTTKQNVVVILDICHMLKLIRNTLKTHNLIDSDVNEISWRHIQKLENTQSVQSVLLANKLRKKHVDFENLKMKTSLAAQTLSHSVAAALQSLLNARNQQFEGCEATIKFILIVNNLFHIFNSKRKYNIKFKRPFCKETFVEYNEYFDMAEKYLQELKVVQDGQ